MEFMFSNLELVEFRLKLNKEVTELPHLKNNNWQPEKADYDLVKPQFIKDLANKIWEKNEKAQAPQDYLFEAEQIWEYVRYGIY